MVQEEGILGAARGVAQDEPTDEPGGGGPPGVGVRSLAAPRCRPCTTPSWGPGAHRRIVCAAHFLLAAFLRPSVPRHHDWMQMAVETTDGCPYSPHHGGPL